MRLSLEILGVAPGNSERIGAVDRRMRLLNQNRETVQVGTSEVLVLKKAVATT